MANHFNLNEDSQITRDGLIIPLAFSIAKLFWAYFEFGDISMDTLIMY